MNNVGDAIAQGKTCNECAALTTFLHDLDLELRALETSLCVGYINLARHGVRDLHLEHTIVSIPLQLNACWAVAYRYRNARVTSLLRT